MHRSDPRSALRAALVYGSTELREQNESIEDHQIRCAGKMKANEPCETTDQQS